MKPPGKFTLALHQNTSRAAGFRGSLEGWARAGIQYVELSDALLDEFLKTDNLAAARRLVSGPLRPPFANQFFAICLFNPCNPLTK